MIGEIRDQESADTAITVTITGHFVMSTLHANDTSFFFTRMINEFHVHANTISMNKTVKAVISQRLVQVLCPECKVDIEEAKKRGDIEEKHYMAIKDLFYEDLESLRFQSINDNDCKCCNGRGVKGRTSVVELLIPTGEYLDFIQQGDFRKATEFWYEQKASDGYTGVSYVDDAVAKAKEGNVSLVHINDKLEPILDSHQMLSLSVANNV